MTLKRIKPVKFYFSSHKQLYHAIKNIFGFYPGNIFLYKLAFRHKSALNQTHETFLSNERLEYLGDAILGAVVADYLFKLFPYKDEGFLTEMRSRLVSRDHLNKLSHKLGLQSLIQSDMVLPAHSKSFKGDAFEAFFGALYLDKGYNFTKNIFINNIIKRHIDMEKMQHEEINYKSRLIEWGQKERHEIEFRMVKEKGNGYAKQYVVELFIDNKSYGAATDFSIKGAEKLIAEKGWTQLTKEGVISENNS